MSNQIPIRLAVIGYGYWGPNLVRNFNSLPGVKIEYICDVNPDACARAHADYPDIRKTSALEYVCTTDEVDAVVIATPVKTHYELARLALENNKDVFIEKPMASSADQCEALVFMSKFHNRRLMVGHTFLFSDPVRYIKQLIDDGELGDVLYTRITRVNLGLFRDDVNVAWDLAAHDIAMLNYFYDARPYFADAIGMSHYGKQEDMAFINLKYLKNRSAHIHVSWLDPKKVREVTIVGSKKMLVYDDLADRKITIYDKGLDAPPYTKTFAEFQASYRHGDIYLPKLVETEPLKNEAAEFINACRTGRDPVSCGEIGLAVVDTLEMIDRSMAEKRNK